MADFGVVVDTCVLYGMPVADTVLIAAHRKLFRFYWTQDIFAELERTMLALGHSDRSREAPLDHSPHDWQAATVRGTLHR